MQQAEGVFRRRWLNLPLRRKGLVVTTLPVAALVIFSLSFFAVELQFKAAGKWTDDTLKVFAAIQRVRTLLLEESGAVRAYGLTIDAEHLNTYRGSLADRDAAMQQLATLVRNIPKEREHVNALRGLIEQNQTAVESYIAAVRLEPAAETGASKRWLENNRTLMAKMDEHFTALQQSERSSIMGFLQNVVHAVRLTNIAVLVTLLLGIGGGILATQLFASGIISRVKAVQAAAIGLAEGRTPAPDHPANDEIGRLSEALHRTAALLEKKTADGERRTQELATMQAARQKQANLLQCILDSMSEGVVVGDRSGRIVLSNPAVQQLFGEGIEAPPEQWFERASILKADTLTPCPLEELPLMRAIRGENPPAMRLRVTRVSGEDTWIEVTAQPLRGDQEEVRGAVSVIRDVTASKLHEESLKTARQAAEEANLAKSEFLSRMSHELRTPLNAILGFGQLLDMDNLTPPQRQSVDQILKGGRHLLNLINEVLDLARIEAGKLALSTEPIESGETVNSSIELLGPLAQQSGVSIRLEESPEWKRYVLADQQRFQQVVLNLLSNGIKYNKRGGTVTVSCQLVAPDRMRLSVRDTGDGLAPEKLTRLFRPFERLCEERYGVEGTGIGLALSKRLVDAMGGAIGVESRLGGGSTFWVELPVCEGPMAGLERLGEATRAEEALEIGAPKTAKLLYIEDNLSNSLLMARILENRPGVELITSMQGRLGFELALQQRPDLICLDLHLPDMNGNEVLRLLRSQAATAHIPVAMISADATQGQIDRLMAAGANHYFTKPLDVKAILLYVDEVLGVIV